VSVSLEREPDSAIAAGVDGDVHQTIVARDTRTGRIAAIAARSVRDAFVNGQPSRLGYLAQLRIDESFRHERRSLLAGGFAFCRSLHERGDADLYLTSVVEDNRSARRLLEGGLRHIGPAFVRCESFVTVAISLRRRLASASRRTVRSAVGRASRHHIEEIAACLQRNGRRYQFAPVWTASDLLSDARTPGLTPEDFLVSTDGGRVVGCVACWDQRAFKQVVVRGYAPRLARWRPVLNATGRWTGLPALPPVGEPLDFAYLSHLAVDEDRADVLERLVTAACRQSRDAGLSYVVLAFAASNPMLRVVRERFVHRKYVSVLYVGRWPEGERTAARLDGRIPHPEVAVL
jgi:hypothetical protein